jgi:hypothetical protein
MLLAQCQGGEWLQERLQAPKIAIVFSVSCFLLQNSPSLHNKCIYCVKAAFETVPSRFKIFLSLFSYIEFTTPHIQRQKRK